MFIPSITSIVAINHGILPQETMLVDMEITMQCVWYLNICPDSKVRGANMGPAWGRKESVGPHVGHVNHVLSGCCIDRSARWHEAQFYWHRHEIRKLLWCLNFVICLTAFISLSFYAISHANKTNANSQVCLLYIVPGLMLIQIKKGQWLHSVWSC